MSTTLTFLSPLPIQKCESVVHWLLINLFHQSVQNLNAKSNEKWPRLGVPSYNAWLAHFESYTFSGKQCRDESCQGGFRHVSLSYIYQPRSFHTASRSTAHPPLSVSWPLALRSDLKGGIWWWGPAAFLSLSLECWTPKRGTLSITYNLFSPIANKYKCSRMRWILSFSSFIFKQMMANLITLSRVR